MGVNAQDYQKLWNEFNENIENFLPESAGNVLDKIEKQAKKDKNDVQMLKTAIKRCEILNMKEENPKDTIVGYCKSYLPKLSKESQMLLNIEIAKYTYKFDDVLAYKDDDFIKGITMEKYADIFPEDSERSVFDIDIEPTLYDYVMHCLIKHYRFFKVEDELYAKLLDFDWNNNFIKAYYNNRMEQIGNIYNKEDFDKYSALAEECIDNEYVAKIKIKQIEFLAYVNTDTKQIKNALVLAKKLCDETMAILDKSHPLYKQCVEFNNSLMQKTIDVRINNVNVTNKPIAVGLTYRNTTNPSYKIFKVTANEFRAFPRLKEEDLKKTLLAKKAVAETTVNTTEETDYEEHSSLIALPALQSGCYYLVFSNNDSFKKLDDIVLTPFQVTELSYFTLDTDDCLNVYVVNRETGEPMGDVTAHFARRDFDYMAKSYVYKTIGEAVSDKNGFLMAPIDQSTAFYIDLYGKNDTLLANNTEHFNPNTVKDKIIIRTNIYTDRAIYRPGQTVRFKGIIVRKTSKTSELLPNYEELVCLYDPNYKIVDSVRVTTDDYGAFYGQFVIPSDRMRGNYQIKHEHDGVGFRVEDYKRPTFEVTFNAPDKEYRIGDSVRVTGTVAALSGFGLDNVNYKYTIVRKASLPYRFYDWTPYYIEDETIATGEGLTMTDGNFSIDFKLVPSRNVPVRNIPLYNYEIKVQTTSKQGETQEGSYTVTATYNRFDIGVCSKENGGEITEDKALSVDETNDLMVNVSSISGKAVSAKIDCKIYKFSDITQYNVDLGNFDRQLLSDQMLKAYFPHYDYYAKEHITKDLVYQNVIDVDGKAPLISGNEKLKPGQYLIELKAVDDTLSVYYNKCIVFDAKTKKMPYKSLCWTHIDKNKAQPGETINYYVGSSEKNVSALIIVKHCKKIVKTERVILNDGVYRCSYKVREADRGQLDFQVALEKHNMEARHIDYVDVPFDNMDLSVTLNKERSYLLPGEEETWSVTVKDYKNKPVSAALMAVMYDASLDNFAKLDWALRTKPTIFSASTIMADKSFGIQVKYQPFDISTFLYQEVRKYSSVSLLPSYSAYRNGKNDYVDRLYYTKATEIVMEDVELAAEPQEETETAEPNPNPPAKIRKDFNETAFFYPDLRTDEKGVATFTFTMPDALTRWNLKLLTYSKTLSVGNLDKTIVTRQPLMIMADMPRFVYDEDTLWIAANVINMTEEELYATANLKIFDQAQKPVNLLLSDATINIKEAIPAGQSHVVRWKVAMQKDLNPLIFRFTAMTEGFNDSEQHMLPVLSTDIFMTQTFALTVNPQSVKDFEFNIGNNDERTQGVMLDCKANPVLYAVQALPYLADDNEKYVTSAFNRLFVNMMAREIIKSNPDIKEMYSKIEESDKKSELEKYEEVKAILLQATPWVLDANDETEQRANVAKLFDEEEIEENINSAKAILANRQTENGGWPWINGMPESEYTTYYILDGMGRLGINNKVTENAFHYIENQIVERYKRLDTSKKKKNAICDFSTMKELMAMSHYTYKTSEDFDEAKAFYIDKLYKDWRRYEIEEQAYIALIFTRTKHSAISQLIIKSLRERALRNEFGMYWRNIGIESEARILEAFNEVDPKIEETDAMRLWILTQKRTNMWENDRATVEAVFAIMNRGTKWENDDVNAMLSRDGDDVKVLIENPTNHVVWGGLYRQYFVPIDKIQKHNDALKIKREIVADGDIKVGDKVKVVITFENSQDMEYVYLKDLRGACFEPKEQISRYHWENGLWYYQSTTDISMEYFFERVPKGKHEVSYEVYVTKDGSFSAGYSQIQCQYAPEFGAYSNGSRINIQ